tara:strand:- start:97 stop:333 length:237 start_codon:yes stop_codon:yes gene_type:complete
MTEELNYLSEKIEKIEHKIALLSDCKIVKDPDMMQRLKKHLRIYNNILSALTHNELVMFSEPKPYDPNDTSGIKDVPF